MTDGQINQAIAKALGWRQEDGVWMWTVNRIDDTCPELWDWRTDLAQSIVENLQRSIMEADALIDKLEAALERIRDTPHVIYEPVRQIAREALT